MATLKKMALLLHIISSTYDVNTTQYVTAGNIEELYNDHTKTSQIR